MIIPMKKAAIITQSKDSSEAIGRLRSLGILHVEHTRAPKGKDINALNDNIALISQAIAILDSTAPSLKVHRLEESYSLDRMTLVRRIIDSSKRIEQLDDYLRNLEIGLGKWDDWGDFDPEKIEALSAKGVYIRLYQIPVGELKNLPEGIAARVISRAGGIASCACVSREKIDMPFRELALPKAGPGRMRERMKEDLRATSAIRDEIKGLIRYRGSLASFKKEMESELEFQEAVAGMGFEGEIAYITGYVPFDKIALLQGSAKIHRWGLSITDPSEDDVPPTLIRNPRWVALISPVLKFLEILPGYKELDISLPFLIFFSMFFGMLIGDAGYGLVYTILTFVIERKMKKRGADTSSMPLFYILGFCAIAWGACTGTFFGQEWVLKTGYKPLIPALTNEKSLQRFCFFLGAAHLSIAHAWRATLKLPSLSALADIGWIMVLWSAFFIANMLILGDPFPLFVKWLMITGIALVVLFTSPQRNILKCVGSGLGTVALSLMNSFTDVVSYVRLFAVGLAGVAIADAFNAMAGLLGASNLFAIAGSALIVLVGHTLGMLLGPVSVLVHGVRLNVLEFSGHANISWSGINYKPLK